MALPNELEVTKHFVLGTQGACIFNEYDKIVPKPKEEEEPKEDE